jgi:hypothetical protein
MNCVDKNNKVLKEAGFEPMRLFSPAHIHLAIAMDTPNLAYSSLALE